MYYVSINTVYTLLDYEAMLAASKGKKKGLPVAGVAGRRTVEEEEQEIRQLQEQVRVRLVSRREHGV